MTLKINSSASLSQQPLHPAAPGKLSTLPWTLLQNIQTFLLPRERTAFQITNHSWLDLYCNDGHFDHEAMDIDNIKKIFAYFTKNKTKVTSIDLIKHGYFNETLVPILTQFHTTELRIAIRGTNETLEQTIASVSPLNVTHLVIDPVYVDKNFLPSLKQIPTLKYLEIKYWKPFLSIDSLSTLKLEELVLKGFYNADATDKLLSDLGSISSLKKLDLGNFRAMTNIGIQSLSGLRALKYLKLAQLPFIEDTAWASLGHLPLEELVLEECSIGNIGLASLKECPLATLFLKRCDKISHEGVRSLSQLNSLKYLTLQDCHLVTDASIECLSDLRIEELDISCCRITNRALAALALFPLKKLNVGYSRDITDTGMDHLVSLPLTHLNLRNCHRITHAGIAKIAHLPITDLNLDNCLFLKLNDRAIPYLSRLPLRRLNLEYAFKKPNTPLQQRLLEKIETSNVLREDNIFGEIARSAYSTYTKKGLHELVLQWLYEPPTVSEESSS